MRQDRPHRHGVLYLLTFVSIAQHLALYAPVKGNGRLHPLCAGEHHIGLYPVARTSFVRA